MEKFLKAHLNFSVLCVNCLVTAHQKAAQFLSSRRPILQLLPASLALGFDELVQYQGHKALFYN